VDETIQRILPACVLTLAAHSLLLHWHLESKPLRLPQPEKISVTLLQVPSPPPPQKKITKELPAPPVIEEVKRQPLEQLPPQQHKIAKKHRKIPAIKSVEHKVLDKLPPPQRRISRKRPSPPPVVPAPRLQPLATLPPAQRRISRQFPRISAEALAEQVLPQPMATLPPEPEPVWEEVVEEEIVPVASEPQYEEILHEETSPYPEEVVWEEPLHRQRVVRQERRHMRQRQQRVRREPVSQSHGRNYAQQARASSGNQEAAPLYASNPAPKYPIQARRRGLEGTVLLEALIDTSGRVIDLRLSTSSGHSILDRAALQSVRGWRFQPGMIGGQPQQMWVKVPVRFALN
jgi:protein TonB